MQRIGHLRQLWSHRACLHRVETYVHIDATRSHSERRCTSSPRFSPGSRARLRARFSRRSEVKHPGSGFHESRRFAPSGCRLTPKTLREPAVNHRVPRCHRSNPLWQRGSPALQWRGVGAAVAHPGCKCDRRGWSARVGGAILPCRDDRAMSPDERLWCSPLRVRRRPTVVRPGSLRCTSWPGLGKLFVRKSHPQPIRASVTPG